MATTTAPLLSPHWYRVAATRPRLRAGVRVSPQVVRGETWYLLTDPTSGRHHRFNELAWRLVAACDGRRTLDEIWAGWARQGSGQQTTQDEAVRVVAQAVRANLLAGDGVPDPAALARADRRDRRRRARGAVNPLAFKVPLWDPDAAVARLARSCGWLCTAAVARVVIAVMVLGALVLAAHVSEVAAYAREHGASARLLLVMWVVYPLLKALHELAHALVVKVFGGEVREMGVTLFMLTPVPYVDASASMGFSDKRRRMAVAGAGIAVEGVLATAALLLWLALEPGLPRDIAFAVLTVGGLSTLAVNGNPLLRFDGYHVLCDLFELPNLAQRSARCWQFLLKRGLLRVQGVRFDGHARGAAPWLLAYAPLSWLYRGALLVGLSTWLSGRSTLLGLAVLALAAWTCVLQPALAALRYLARSPELHGQRWRAGVLASALVLVPGALAFGLPLPHRTQAPGVVWLQDEALVRLGVDGFVEEFLARDGEQVAAGQPVLRLSNDELQADLQRVQAHLARLEVERASSFDADALRAGLAVDERARLMAEHERLEQRLQQLVVRAAIGGRLVVAPQLSRVGQYLPQGELVAHVLAPGAPLVRALVRNEDVAQVRDDTRSVSVVLAHAAIGESAAARVAAAVPRAGTALPSAALGDTAGGTIALDSRDRAGLTALEPRFQVDLRLEPGTDARIGARALVTFRHADASAAELAADFARRSFLRYFER